MIPSQTDGVARILAGLGLEKLASLNKLDPEGDAEKQKQEQEQAEKEKDAAPIDDSQSNTPTVTTHDNEPTGSQPVNSQSTQPSQPSQPSRTEPVHGNNTQAPESAKPQDSGKAKDLNTLDPATNTDDYLQSLFERLRAKIREAFNSSDEVTLH